MMDEKGYDIRCSKNSETGKKLTEVSKDKAKHLIDTANEFVLIAVQDNSSETVSTISSPIHVFKVQGAFYKWLETVKKMIADTLIENLSKIMGVNDDTGFYL